MSYRKTGTEWEILGDLAARLHHKVRFILHCAIKYLKRLI